MSNLSRPIPESNEKNEHLKSSAACERVVHHKSEVSIPVSIQPYAVTGCVEIKCCGHPHIIKRESKNACHFIITQEISIDIPVKFGAVTEISDSHIDCKDTTVEDCE